MISLVLLIVATIGIVSTGPGFTLLGLIQLSTADSGGLFGTAAEKAYILYGLLIGLAFGPVQASSRSYMARSVTAAESGRYFGIYALAGRATSFLAPVHGGNDRFGQRLGAARHGGNRAVPRRRPGDPGPHAVSGGPAAGGVESAFPFSHKGRREEVLNA